MCSTTSEDCCREGSRLTIFSILFGVFYLAAFYYDLALFRYYPEVGQFHLLRNDGLGVVILWYGWIATAALASAAVALAVPRQVAERLWPAGPGSSRRPSWS